MIAEYYYDPFGRRLWKDVDGVRTYFVYSDEGLIGEYDAAGVEIKSYGYKPGSTWSTDPLFIKQNGEYYFYTNDHLGIRDVLNYLNNLLKQTIVVAKCNRFPSLYGIADTGDGHIKLAGKIGQRHFQLTRRPVTKQSFGINSWFLAAFAQHFIKVNVIDRCHFYSHRI